MYTPNTVQSIFPITCSFSNKTQASTEYDTFLWSKSWDRIIILVANYEINTRTDYNRWNSLDDHKLSYESLQQSRRKIKSEFLLEKHTIFTWIKPAMAFTLLTVPRRKAQWKCRLPQSTVFWCALQVIVRVRRQALLRRYSPCSKGNVSNWAKLPREKEKPTQLCKLTRVRKAGKWILI